MIYGGEKMEKASSWNCPELASSTKKKTTQI